MSLSLCITCCDLDLHLLDGLLNEFRKQTAAPNEIIISSSGISHELLSHYKDLKINQCSVPIKIVNNTQRHFQAAARNLGARISNSEYIMFFDVDDIPHPQKIELCQLYVKGYDFLLHSYFPNAKYSCFTTEGLALSTNFSLNPTCTNLSIDMNSGVHHSHITVKKSVFDSISYNESPIFYRKEDGKFCQDLVSFGRKGIYLNLPLVNYR